MQKNRVVITGMGAVTPLGIGCDHFFKCLIQGKSGIARIKQFDPQFQVTQIAGEVSDYNTVDFFIKRFRNGLGGIHNLH